jgi:hypothetical protein
MRAYTIFWIIMMHKHLKGAFTMQSILIKDTTREQREAIIRQSLASCGGSCEFCNGCDNLGGGRVEDIYRPYIEGEKEIAQINMEYRSNLVR